MSMMFNQAAAELDEQFREIFGIKSETTYAYLVRTARTDDSSFFVLNMRQAMCWMLPQVTPRTRSHFDEIVALLDSMEDSLDELDEDDLSVRKEHIMLLFEQAHSMIRYEPTLSAQENFNLAQRARASKPRATDEDVARRIVKAYRDSQQNGTSYGMVKKLAGQYEVSQTTIHNYIRKYSSDEIDK